MKIVICGSMSVFKKMVEVGEKLTKLKHEVVLPKDTEKYASEELTGETSHESTQNKIEDDLIRSYFNEIKACDAVVIVNVDKGGVENYIGGNSFLEAGFAHVLSKHLYFLNPIPEMIYSDELKAMQPIIINHDGWSYFDVVR